MQSKAANSAILHTPAAEGVIIKHVDPNVHKSHVMPVVVQGKGNCNMVVF